MIIATRELTAIGKSGAKLPVTLTLEAPTEQDGVWWCWYEIGLPEDGWPSQTVRSNARGADAMHALQLALMKLGVELASTSYHREGKLYWVEGRVGNGLIVPKDARDLLRGDDTVFYG